MCQVPPYSHTGLPLGKMHSRIKMGKKAYGLSSLVREKHLHILFWQQDNQLHGIEWT